MKTAVEMRELYEDLKYPNFNEEELSKKVEEFLLELEDVIRQGGTEHDLDLSKNNDKEIKFIRSILKDLGYTVNIFYINNDVQKLAVRI